MATNEILQFASTDTGTNLLTQAEYSADAQRTTGNQPGIARSKLVNKSLRQASTLAAGLAQFIATYQANNVVDSLTPAQIATYLYNALQGSLAVTPPQFDNDTSIATTAFVQRALGNRAASVGYTANATQPATDWGKTTVFTGTGNFTVTTPSVAGVPIGATLEYANFANNSVTIQSVGPNFQGSGFSATTTFTILPGQAITAVYDGASFDIVNFSGPVATRPQFDSSLLQANTAFVQRALGNMRGINYTANSTLTISPDQVGQGWISGGGTNTFILPLSSAVPEGATIYIYCQGGTATVQRQGSDNIGVGLSTINTSFFMTSNEFVTLVRNGAGWQVLNGSPMLPNCGLYANSKAQSGYTRFPNGIILQWGRVNAGNTGGVYDVSFPITFPNAGFAGMANDWSNSVTGSDINAVDFLTQTYMRVWCCTNADTVNESNFWWFAVGY